MSSTPILKAQKTLLNGMTELTPENKTFIVGLFQQGIPAKLIYINLPTEMKRDPQVIELCMQYARGKKLAFQLILAETEMNSIDLLKIANRVCPDWVVTHLKNNRIEINDLIDLASSNPKIFDMLRLCNIYTQEEKDQVYAVSPTWVKDGKPVHYMKLSKNVQFNGRSDYLKFVQAYITEGTSLIKFCRKYQISRSEFSTVLELISSEDIALKKQIEQTKEKATQRYMSVMTDLVDTVISGKTTIRNIILGSKANINGWDFLNCKSFIPNDKAQQLILTMVSELTPKTTDFPQDNFDVKYHLSNQGISLEELSKWFDQGKDQPIEDIRCALEKIREKFEFSSSPTLGPYQDKAYKLEKVVHEHSGDAIPSKIIGSFFEANPNTKLTITPKTLQDALTIIKAHNKVPSHRLAVLISKDILSGQIQQSEIDDAYRITTEKALIEQQKVERRELKMANLRTVDEYIAYINTPQQQQEYGVQEGDVQE